MLRKILQLGVTLLLLSCILLQVEANEEKAQAIDKKTLGVIEAILGNEEEESEIVL